MKQSSTVNTDFSPCVFECLLVHLFNTYWKTVTERKGDKVCVGVGVNLWQQNRRRETSVVNLLSLHSAFYRRHCPVIRCPALDSALTWAWRTSRGNDLDAHDWLMIAANVNWLLRIKMVLREVGFVLLFLLQFKYSVNCLTFVLCLWLTIFYYYLFFYHNYL